MYDAVLGLDELALRALPARGGAGDDQPRSRFRADRRLGFGRGDDIVDAGSSVAPCIGPPRSGFDLAPILARVQSHDGGDGRSSTFIGLDRFGRRRRDARRLLGEEGARRGNEEGKR